MLFGSKARQDTFRLSVILTLVHTDPEFEIAVFFHNPPLTPPAKTVSRVGSFGSNIIALVLPPTFVGPLSTQLLSTASPGTLPEASIRCLSSNISLRITSKFSGVGLPNAGFMVNSHSFS